MRWSIRSQLLAPLALLLLGLAGVCTWTARESARLARQRIAGQMHGVARTLNDADFPLNQHVLDMVKGLSGADFLVYDNAGQRTATFAAAAGELPAAEPFRTED